MSGTYLEESCRSSEEAGFNAGGDATEPVQTCEYAEAESHYAPCDAEDLAIRNQTDAQIVRCTVPAARDASLSAAQGALLEGDDLLLQAVADYDHDGSYDPAQQKKALIALSAGVDPPCPLDLHTELRWSVRNGASRSFPVNTSLPPFDLLAQSTRAFSGTGGFLKPFWSFGKDRRVIGHVIVDSCGVREGQQPNQSLRGRVEIWPNDRFELIFKIPPFRKIKQQQAGYKDLKSRDRVRSGSASDSGSFGAEGSSRSWSHSTNTAAGSQFGSETRTTTSAGVTDSRTYKGGRKKNEEFELEEESRSVRGTQLTDKITTTTDMKAGTVELSHEETVTQQVSLKRNGVELDISKSVDSLIVAARSFKSAFDNFKNAVPKLGWQADLDISIFEGSITGTWGVVPEARADHARIWKVKEFYSVTFDVKLIYVKAEIGFGLDCRVENWFASDPLLEVVLKVTGSLTLDVPAAVTFSSDKRANVEEKISAATTPKLEAKARASAMGYAAGASIDIACGFTVSGSLKCGLEAAPAFTGKVEWVPIKITARVEYPGSKPWVKVVFQWPDGAIAPIWQGVLPNTPSAR
ncbi:MAG: hypothetical protein H5U17_06675 [Defluviimonas sp.]|nr:hypothetical protein [Defluviimonas sp.]